MATREEIVTLTSYVLAEKNRQLLIASGLEAVSTDRRIAALRGLQDLGWISHAGFADFEESYSVTKEGRRIVSAGPGLDRLDRKIREYISAMRLSDSDSNGDRKDGLKRMIEIACDLGNWDSALLDCYELRKLAERTRDVGLIAFAFSHQGRVEMAQNRWAEALESFLNAVEKYMEAGDRKGVCSTNREMGIIYGSKGDLPSSKRCFESSYSLAKDMGDRESEIKAEANLAILYDLEGKGEESERASKDCMAYFLEVGDDPNALRTSNNLGVLNLSREKFQVAAEYFEKTIGAARTLKFKEVLGAALVNAGYCYARIGDTGRCLSYTDEAVSIFKEPNDLNMLALAYRNYGYIEFRSSNINKAFEWFEKSVRSAKSSDVQDTVAACCCEYGMALIEAMVDLRLAKKLLKKSSSAYRDIGNMARAKKLEARLEALPT
ncbi:MAG: hypothetical protein A3K67_05700 [Euryarchaeota archaeon RBG_16_62_10]|nr:MAG: hypothetical protein A3K67_05700 [Euryarchaeota archaeon RBG_16_62_10]